MFDDDDGAYIGTWARSTMMAACAMLVTAMRQASFGMRAWLAVRLPGRANKNSRGVWHAS